MLSTKTAARTLAALVVASLAAIALTAPASGADATTVRIWTDKDRIAAVTKVANAWAASKGATVEVVQKDFGSIRDNLKTVQAETAPDVIVGAHDWIGELSANGSIVPLFPSTATAKQFPAYALDAFSYGTAVKKLYGAPVALENIALVTNTKLAKVPTTWAQLQASALATKKKTKAAVGISVQQGAGGDAYHMYPLFAGLGGYIFGKNSAGNLDPSNIGIANPKFLKNAALIDQWNKLGLIRSSVDSSISQDLFLKGQTAFWFTGPVEPRHAEEVGPLVQDLGLPADRRGHQGRAVPRRAGVHGHEVRGHPQRREPREGPRLELHDAGRSAARARAREHPLSGEPQRRASRSRTRSSRPSARRAPAASRCRTSRR